MQFNDNNNGGGENNMFNHVDFNSSLQSVEGDSEDFLDDDDFEDDEDTDDEDDNEDETEKSGKSAGKRKSSSNNSGKGKGASGKSRSGKSGGKTTAEDEGVLLEADDDFFKDDDEEDDENEEKGNKKVPKKKAVAATDDDEDDEEDDDNEDDEDDDTIKEEDETDEDDEEDEDELDEEQEKQVVTATYEHLVKKGIWIPLETKKGQKIELDAASFGKVAEMQATEMAKSAFEELASKTGKYRTILDHALKNGEPEKIFDLFKQEYQNDNIDLKIPEGQEQIIKAYYKNIVGWSDEKITKNLDKWKADESLKEEADFAKEKYSEFIEKEKGRLAADAQAKTQKELNDKKKYQASIANAIRGLDMPASEKKALYDFIIEPSVKAGDKKLTAWQALLTQLQANPQSLVQAVRILKNPKLYAQQQQQRRKNNEAEENFTLRSKGNKSRKSTGGKKVGNRNAGGDQTELRFVIPS